MNQFIIQKIREIAIGGNALEVANELDELLDEGLEQSHLIFYFRAAFPRIPLRILIRSSEWRRVGGGTLDDDGFVTLFSEWLPLRE